MADTRSKGEMAEEITRLEEDNAKLRASNRLQFDKLQAAAGEIAAYKKKLTAARQENRQLQQEIRRLTR